MAAATANGYVNKDGREAEQRLYGAAVANGYVGKDGREAALATIRSGLASGASDPRKIPEGPPETDESLVAEGGEIAERFIAAAEEKAKEAEHKEAEVSQAFVATLGSTVSTTFASTSR